MSNAGYMCVYTYECTYIQSGCLIIKQKFQHENLKCNIMGIIVGLKL